MSNRARILVKVRVPDLLEIHVSHVICESLDDYGHGKSWTCAAYICMLICLVPWGAMRTQSHLTVLCTPCHLPHLVVFSTMLILMMDVTQMPHLQLIMHHRKEMKMIPWSRLHLRAQSMHMTCLSILQWKQHTPSWRCMT